MAEPGRIVTTASDRGRADRRRPPGGFPVATFAQIRIWEFALESEQAAGVAERIYARSGEQPMSAAAGLGS